MLWLIIIGFLFVFVIINLFNFVFFVRKILLWILWNFEFFNLILMFLFRYCRLYCMILWGYWNNGNCCFKIGKCFNFLFVIGNLSGLLRVCLWVMMDFCGVMMVVILLLFCIMLYCLFCISLISVLYVDWEGIIWVFIKSIVLEVSLVICWNLGWLSFWIVVRCGLISLMIGVLRWVS